MPRRRSIALVGSGTAATAAEGAVVPKKLEDANVKPDSDEVSSASPLIVYVGL